MIKNITYENKEAIQNDPDLPERNMITDANMNEIKEVVNNNAQELQNEIKELEEDIKANAIIEETEKEKSLYISDASGARGRLDVLGNVEQEVTETSPSIDYPSPLKILGDNTNEFDYKNAEYILGYVDTTMKKIIASDSTRQHYFSYLKCNPNTTYTISKEIGKSFRVGTFSQKPAVGVAYNNTVANHTARSITITTGENDNYIGFVCFSKESGDVGNYLDMYSTVKVEEGSTATSYSPYNQGSTKISKINKNLFDKSNANILKAYIGQTSKKITVGTYHRTIFLKVNSGDTYTIKKHTGIGLIVGQLKEFPKIEDVVDNFIMTGSETPSITAKILDGYNYLVAYVVNNENNTEDEILNSIQIEKGNTATDPVEHQEQNYILDIQQPMLKEDYFDLDRKKEVHVTNKIVLDGTKKFVVGNPAGRYYLDTELNNSSYEAISNCFKQGAENTFNVDNTIVLQANRINLMNKEIATAEEFNNAVLELYNAGTPIEIYYPTTEPTELDLTESQIQVLEQLNKLRLYKEVNNIFTLEDIALLQAEYSVNIQSKINSLINAKISELNQPELLNE